MRITIVSHPPNLRYTQLQGLYCLLSAYNKEIKQIVNNQDEVPEVDEKEGPCFHGPSFSAEKTAT
jgi:hypothetical protein